MLARSAARPNLFRSSTKISVCQEPDEALLVLSCDEPAQEAYNWHSEGLAAYIAISIGVQLRFAAADNEVRHLAKLSTAACAPVVALVHGLRALFVRNQT